ncbi:MAG: peptidylprolyl isomerase [Calditrichaeota bacterium]|nr:MAG: peptidylprolyl isomerase [Calditrichota bacterium]
MAQAKAGNTVKVHYRGLLEDGSVFDDSLERGEPFEFKLGAEMVIPGFENAVLGMAEGETKVVTLSPDEAYGPYRQDLTIDIQRAQLPEHIEPAVGKRLRLRAPDGSINEVFISQVTEDTVTIDANHPLAGKTLTFEIQLVEIVE